MTLHEITSVSARQSNEHPDDCMSVAEDRIVRDVYGCDAGRGCTQVTPTQRIGFEKQIADRIAGLSAHTPEGT